MKEELKFHIRMRIFYEEKNFGPGVASLMTLVKEKGSLSAATREMGMAYSKAWKIIKKAEKDLGFILMEGQSGGSFGGNTILTIEGEEFLEKYIKFVKEVQKFAEERFNTIFE